MSAKDGDIRVMPESGQAPHRGLLSWAGEEFPCALGTAGIGEKGGEGDGITPVGCFSLRRVHYRPDRIPAPKTALPLRALAPEDGWCDDPDDSAYNRLIRMPHGGSHENLWRDDALYDLIVELGYNDDPVVPGLGSAIFLHLAEPDYPPTQGCIALAPDHLATVLAGCGAATRLCVSAG